MKTNTFIKKTELQVLGFFTILLSFSTAFGQVQQNGSLYIGDNGLVSVFTSPFNFGTSPSTTVTTRTDAIYGKLYFPVATTWASASDTHHVNGYVSTFGNADFTFPVGNGTVYAPARVQGASTSNAYDCAYYTANPTTIGATIDNATLEAISSVEYWDVKSSSTALLSLTWRAASDLSNLLVGVALEDIVIAGYNSTTNQWEQIPSVVDLNYLGTGAASNLTAGSITSTIPVPFGTYSKFTLAAKGSCQPLVASSGVTKTWNGSWSPSAPTLADPVVIDAAYSGGSFACNSLVLNAEVTLAADENIEIVNGVTGASKIIMATSASVVQRATGVGKPNIEMTKTRTALKRYDYVYFGTPVAGDFYGDMASAIAVGGVAGAFDFSYKYVTGAGGGWAATSATETGKGFIAHVGQAAPFLDASTTADVSVVIDGVANNGDINVGSFTNDIGQPYGGRSHILLGNPYPSAIDGDKFLVENTAIDGVLYVWNSAVSYPGSGNYTQADYLSYTRAGFVAPTAITANFNGKIPSGQGFKVRITPTLGSETTTSATANITFNNCMRVVDNNTNFYRATNANATASNTTSTPKDRFKLNMTGANGVFSQILVAYLPQATLGYDRMYDAGRNSVSTAQFYSIFEGDGRRLAINARPTFTTTDVVPVGIRKNNTNAETFVLGITAQEGVFTDPNVKVYLHDKVANTFHDFSTGDFTYTTTDAVTNERFEIVYQTTALSNPTFVSLDATIVLNNNTLAATAEATIKAIQIYDITGRLIQNYQDINAETFNAAFVHEESIYVAKITFDNGTTVSKKLIHSKN
ncbi:T9SS type A sorting domain-containing protein [Flavobacterium sp.]|uniref:T9SS type A sorting domain-containing protein n=1 Tax=Flavobacterium sp. TaxID=239 RepID=UPI003F699F91